MARQDTPQLQQSSKDIVLEARRRRGASQKRPPRQHKMTLPCLKNESHLVLTTLLAATSFGTSQAVTAYLSLEKFGGAVGLFRRPLVRDQKQPVGGYGGGGVPT